nr:type II toxin-antitoxin system Phd/YefM family antitoxin [Anaerolineae bacterium]
MSTVTISLTEAKQNLGEVINWAAYGGKRVTLLSRGKPRIVLISIDDLQRLDAQSDERELRKARRRAWLEEARALRERILKRRGGVPLPDSVEELRALREERDEQIMGLR